MIVSEELDLSIFGCREAFVSDYLKNIEFPKQCFEGFKEIEDAFNKMNVGKGILNNSFGLYYVYDGDDGPECTAGRAYMHHLDKEGLVSLEVDDFNYIMLV